jgi:hypothetical protein
MWRKMRRKRRKIPKWEDWLSQKIIYQRAERMSKKKKKNTCFTVNS